MTTDHGPEVLPALDLDAARRLDGRIRRISAATAEHFSKLFDLVTEARQGDIHLALGFTSWTAYLADALKELGTVVNAVERRQLVDWLSHQGMSERAMARALGCSQPTIHRDRVAAQAQRQAIHNESPETSLELTLVSREAETAPPPSASPPATEAKHKPHITGLDGKTYTPPPVAPAAVATKRRRVPITDSFSRTTSDLTRTTERLDRLREDDRFKNNIESLRQHNRWRLTEARDAINRCLAELGDEPLEEPFGNAGSLHLLSPRNRRNVAACEALEMAFIEEHHNSKGKQRTLTSVWAMDSKNAFHVVSVDRKTSTAQHVCGLFENELGKSTRCRKVSDPIVFREEMSNPLAGAE
jgi:hypothetical protein